MDSKKPLYKSISFWIMVLFLLYSALGFLAVPYFIEKQLTSFAKSELNSTLIVDDINFNPYTISINTSSLKLIDNDQTTWFKANQIYININLWSSILFNPSVAKIQIDEPYYQLVINNFSDGTTIKYPKISSTTQPKQEDSLQLDIAAIAINQGKVAYISDLNEKTLNFNIKGIIFKHQSFTTRDQETPIELSFTTDNDDKTELKGLFNFAKTSLKANWNLKHWSTNTIFDFIGDSNNNFIGINNKSGLINANGTVNYFPSNKPLPDILIEKFELLDFSGITQSEEELKISIPQLLINMADIDLNNQQLNIANIQSNQSDITLGVDKNNQLLWNNNVENTEATSNETWKINIEQLSLDDSYARIHKLSKDSQVSTNNFHIETFNIKNFSNQDLQKSTLDAILTVDDSGKITINSQLQISPIDIKSDISITDFNLEKIQAWLPEDITLKIERGQLSLTQQIIINNVNYSSKGSITLNDVILQDQSNQEFFSINKLEIDQSSVNSKSRTITLNNIKLDKAEGTILISEDQQLNLTGIINTENNITTKKSQEKDWIIEISQIELKNAKTEITDKSIKPNYHSELTKINGNIKGLSSNNLSKADIKLSGVLDNFGELNIQGQINPLSENAFTDIKIAIKNLDIQSFSSYSSLYLGFPINRGKADFELQYKLNQKLLKGSNNLTFKQLQFGEKSASKDAINLPLKLAVNLLTDGKGIMQINLPVSGKIDDPSFSYGGIVFKAFFKLITGIVASPFKLLGKLIPGAENLDLSGIKFQTGTQLLETGEQAKLAAMQNIIKQRPGLILEITAVTNTITDNQTLQQSALFTKLNIDTKPDFTKTLAKDSIAKLYITTFTKDKWQKLITDATSEQQLNTVTLLKNAWKQLLEAQDVSDQLNQLSKHRAEFIQQQLIEQYAIPQDKIFLKPFVESETLNPQVKFGIAGT